MCISATRRTGLQISGHRGSLCWFTSCSKKKSYQSITKKLRCRPLRSSGRILSTVWRRSRDFCLPGSTALRFWPFFLYLYMFPDSWEWSSVWVFCALWRSCIFRTDSGWWISGKSEGNTPSKVMPRSPRPSVYLRKWRLKAGRTFWWNAIKKPVWHMQRYRLSLPTKPGWSWCWCRIPSWPFSSFSWRLY